ncbi:MAG: DUF4149 domain-containing protein [Nitrospirota bacterium]|nr:DUF4149 domain-containing protein [Nitrospirota bacterium]
METPIPNFYFMGVQFFHLLALAVWVGGIVVIRCIVLPTLLHSTSSPQSVVLVLREVYRKFYKITLFCALVLIATGFIKFMTWENLTPWNAIRYLAIFGMIGISLYVCYGVFPRMDKTSAVVSKSAPENTRELQSVDINDLPFLADWLTMGSLICGMTALLMA